MNDVSATAALRVALPVCLLLLAACTAQEDQSQTSQPDDIEVPSSMPVDKQALNAQSMDNCEIPGSTEELLANARKAAVKKHDPDSLNCAAQAFIKLAKISSEDIELQIEAFTTLEDSLFYLRVIQTLDLMGVNKVNSERIASIGASYHELAEQAYKKDQHDPRLMVHKGLAARETTGAYDADLLGQAIETNQRVLKGLAQVRLGRMLFELPSILGGDFQAAIALFEQAVEVDPQNMQALYYLAEVYEQELEEEKAASTMERMLAVDPAQAQLQMSTDMLRLAVGLSQRIGKAELSAKLKEKRNSLLSANLEIMTRASVAVGGHGGEHPLGEQ
tara:strand:- start:2748 stop:3746 length:999 start_codon:yes stop_codon:yes gene_type:complete